MEPFLNQINQALPVTGSLITLSEKERNPSSSLVNGRQARRLPLELTVPECFHSG